ncbi:MAG: methylmalonyl Co-A mutase-associated GTPase MeaB, partial [Chitinophagaceae bacterium]
VMKAAAFDYIIVETVGVGQSEIEIAGLADLTVVVLVPEGGDEIQTMKAGLMEIADVFVVNKSDRPGADLFVKNLLLLLAPAFHNHTKEVRILKTNALLKEGIRELLEIIYATDSVNSNDKKYWLLAERAFHLVQNERMKDIDKAKLKERIANLDKEGNFNLYGFIKTIV